MAAAGVFTGGQRGRWLAPVLPASVSSWGSHAAAPGSGRLLSTSGVREIEGTGGGLVDHEVYAVAPDLNDDAFEQSPRDRAAVMFTNAGSFEVRCRIHPKMHLHVDVVDR